MLIAVVALGVADVNVRAQRGRGSQPGSPVKLHKNDHSDHDTPDTVPAQGLAASARAYAKIIDRVNTLDRAALGPDAVKSSAVQP